jgi:hypothetical protein
MRQPIPGQKHHWFPKGLAKAWLGPDGLVGRTNSRGHSKRWHPSAIGYTPDNHNVLFDGGSPWDSTFEPQFDAADNAFPDVTRWLETLRDQHPLGQRVEGVAPLNDQRAHLAECLASLVVRSPRLRYLAEKWVAESQVRDFGLREPHNVHITASGNLARRQEPFARAIRTGGKILFLLSDGKDFLFGDGCMTSLNPESDHMLRAMAMVAFTPSVAVLWFNPQSYPSFPPAVSMRLTKAEVSIFNDVVQVYSRDNLFHVGDPPALHESFLQRQHYIVTSGGANHRTPVVDGWMAEALDVSWPG